jgi:hypothetical protein
MRGEPKILYNAKYFSSKILVDKKLTRETIACVKYLSKNVQRFEGRSCSHL